MSDDLGRVGEQVQRDGNTAMLAGVETAVVIAGAILDHLNNRPKAVKVITKSHETTVAQDLEKTRSMLREGKSKAEISIEIQQGSSYQKLKAKGRGEQYMNDLFTSAERKNAANLDNQQGQTQAQKKNRRKSL